MSFSHCQSIRDFVEEAARQFEIAGLSYAHGTDNAIDEAVFLVAGALELPYDFADTDIDAPLTVSQKHAVSDILKQRITSKKPAAYILKQAWFAGLHFYVDERVLVPRSPFAELILDQFQPWIAADKINNVLELCTGSGCIAIATALNLPDVKVDASDISRDALAVAEQNVQSHNLQERVRLIQADVFGSIAEKRYDIIIANPPYVDQQDMDNLSEEHQHEPALGLAAGTDGLDIVKRILRDARNYLSDHGVLFVEVGNSAAALQQQYPQLPFIWLEFEMGGEGVFMLNAKDLKI